MTNTPHVVRNHTIAYDPNDSITPWRTYHRYGEQAHRSRQDAEKWNGYQQQLDNKGW